MFLCKLLQYKSNSTDIILHLKHWLSWTFRSSKDFSVSLFHSQDCKQLRRFFVELFKIPIFGRVHQFQSVGAGPWLLTDGTESERVWGFEAKTRSAGRSREERKDCLLVELDLTFLGVCYQLYMGGERRRRRSRRRQRRRIRAKRGVQRMNERRGCVYLLAELDLKFFGLFMAALSFIFADNGARTNSNFMLKDGLHLQRKLQTSISCSQMLFVKWKVGKFPCLCTLNIHYWSYFIFCFDRDREVCKNEKKLSGNTWRGEDEKRDQQKQRDARWWKERRDEEEREDCLLVDSDHRRWGWFKLRLNWGEERGKREEIGRGE